MFKQINKYDFYENIFHGEEQKFDEVEKQKMSQLFTVKTYKIFNWIYDVTQPNITKLLIRND